MKKSIKPRALNFWNFCLKYCDIELKTHLKDLGTFILEDQNKISKYEGERQVGLTTLSLCLAMHYALNFPGTTVVYVPKHAYSSSFRDSLKEISTFNSEIIHYNKDAFYFKNESKITIIPGPWLNGSPYQINGIGKLIIITDNLNTNIVEHLYATRFQKMINFSSESRLKVDSKTDGWYGYLKMPWEFLI